ncbi:putative F-box/FBD/LRR-repeat protein-like [Capsicum annuum]|nr:putative F-box/FBD/LRR-repeat protein-like [Capsicum annuum]
MAISWTSLKSIKMKEICCEHVVKLLAGCPNLEVMELKSVKAFGRLEINSLKLKKLYLEDLCMDDAGTDFSLEIFGPNLQHFEISGVLEDGKFRLLDVSSLINAYLNFSNSCFCENDCEDEHQGFMTLVVHNFQKLSCVTELTLGSWFNSF